MSNSWPKGYGARGRRRWVWPSAGVLTEFYREELTSGQLREAHLRAWGIIDLGIARGWYLDAVVMERLGQERDVRWAMRRAASAGDPDGLRGWAMILRGEGKFGPAIRALRRAAVLKPDPVWDALELDWRYWAADGSVTAEQLDAAARVESSVAMTYGYMLRAQGEVEQAERQFEAAAEAGQWQAWLPLGNIADEAGNLELALERYQKVVDQGDSHAMFNMASTLSKLGRDAEADKLFQQAAAEDRWARRLLSSERRQRLRERRRRGSSQIRTPAR